jgi:hypothetical protein
MNDDRVKFLGELLEEVFGGVPDGEGGFTYGEEASDDMCRIIRNYEGEVRRKGVIDILEEWEVD